MDICTHSFYLDFLWNSHEWYKINNYNDFVRAISWCAVNLITAYCYFVIPYEISKWSHAVKSMATSWIGMCFIGFIVFCGLHHIVDVIIMPTAPWWAILTVNVPLALVSLGTYIYIWYNRDLILGVLQAIEDLIISGEK